jgi:hypothetical protein
MPKKEDFAINVLDGFHDRLEKLMGRKNAKALLISRGNSRE